MRARSVVYLMTWGWAVALSAAGGEPSRPKAPQTVGPYAVWSAVVPGRDLPTTFGPEQAEVWAEVTDPAGRKLRVSAFLYRAYTRGKDRRGREALMPEGRVHWRVRVASGRIGRHMVRFLVRRKGGAEQVLGRTSFQVAETKDRADGFLRVNDDPADRFVFDSGRGYFALGHNVCWVKREQGTYGFDAYFRKMADAGENYTRVWLCTWGLSLDTQTPHEMDLADAWRLDHVLRRAQERGIYVKLCIDNFYDFRHHFDQSPFNQANGGPCAERGVFFTDPMAKAQYRARLQYLVARYSAYTSLMAWELWNEMDYALDPWDVEGVAAPKSFVTDADLREKILIPWTLEMARTLRRMDLYDHLVTTSIGLHSVWDGLWKSPRISFAQYHSYIHYLDWMRETVEQDAAAFVLAGQQEVSGYDKPAFLAEFGYMGRGETSSMNPQDPDGIALHNALWAGALSGAAGTPMLWWWDNYIEPHDLYYRYKALAAFLADVDWTQSFVPMRIENKALRVLALRSDRTVLLWVQNLENTWYKRIEEQREPETREHVLLALRDFPPGPYRVAWFDPQRGDWLSRHTLDGAKGVLRLRPPPFRLDVAARLTRVGKGER